VLAHSRVADAPAGVVDVDLINDLDDNIDTIIQPDDDTDRMLSPRQMIT
jgi:hypothetical protein